MNYKDIIFFANCQIIITKRYVEYKIIKEGQTGRGILIENDGFYDRVNKENAKIIKEAKQKPDSFFDAPAVFCVLQKYGIENRNKRVYPKPILYNAVEGYMQSVKQRSAIGAVDHEDSTNISLRAGSVGLLIEDIYWDGATCVGKVYLPISRGFKETGGLYCGADQIANLIFYHDIMVGISSRGVGDVEKDKNNGKTIVTEYDLICWDWVQLPSTIGAYAYINQEDTVPHIQKEQEHRYESPKTKSKFDRLSALLNM